MIEIRLNERRIKVPDDTTLLSLREREMPAADVFIVNGHRLTTDWPLAEGDQVVLLQRGRQPSAEEMETLLMARHTPGVHEKVKAATIGIAGLGGLGSAVAIALARLGVGKLVLVDFDILVPSNLNRQQYFIDQLGLPKTQALAETLGRINPFCKVETKQLRLDENNTRETFKDCDIVAECFDEPDAKAMLVRVLAPHQIVVAASGVAGHGPANDIRTRRAMKNLYLIGDEISEARPGRGLMAPRVGVAAHHQANAIMQLLLGEEPA